jgi:RNA polymerase sigma-70 factor (ECF subfamily)
LSVKVNKTGVAAAVPVNYLEQSDEVLMQCFVQGEFQAFEALYQRHKGALYRYFMRQIPNHSLAEDLYQEVWSKVIVSAAKYKAEAKFTTWLYTLAYNRLIDEVRHLSVVSKVIESEGQTDSEDCTEKATINPQEDEQAETLSHHRAVEALKLCLGKLPQAQKDSFLLKEEAGLSVKDIAVVLNANFEACKSRLRYAYENLRQCIALKVRDIL